MFFIVIRIVVLLYYCIAVLLCVVYDPYILHAHHEVIFCGRVDDMDRLD